MAVRRLLPGMLALCLGAVLARALALSLGVNNLFLAIALGVITANVVGVPVRFAPGLETHKLWLGAGIVLMGASISLRTVLKVGGRVFLVVIAVAALTLVVVEFLARTVFGLSKRLSSLLAAGASICGVSAVVAVAGAVSAREDQVAYAAATVLLFDAVTIAVYPIVGDLLTLSGTVFGIWAGVSMFSTGPVVAVGFAHSEVAGQWATMTKLSRNALIGVVALAYASYYARSGARSRPSVRTLWDEFPKFVLGMLALALVASAGVLSATQRASLEHASNWLFLLAFVGLGTEIRLADLRNAGPVPAVVVLLALLVCSAVSLAVLLLTF
ncbi:putative sulfate exporter family transporter [Natrinema sp. CBA1119]|uniref:YeiH family protein n=1 Tax=Natrinema sp. CBA1119 TaxID=1608465 RepID=UPI000BF5AF73|nr:putative sulfate exporter family transporter [Natrinema sp. CBA1119]PGF13837.1 putative sulfate exporter family transporter [Natrinema sp. CBA1119]